MGKLCQNNNMIWWSLFCIYCFTLFGNGGVGKGQTLAMKGRPYFKEEAIIKTFEFNEDIIDCIDIYKQPAFDHPLLKNHTIQMKPTFIPGYSQATISNNSAVKDTHPWLFTKGCPEGSIPIIRTPYNGLVGNYAPASDLHMHHPQYPRERGGIKGKKFDDRTRHEHVMVKFTGNIYKLYGASANFNLQRPFIAAPEEFSTAQMWIVSDDGTTTLEAGWTVFPQLYNDFKTRLFTLWTNNSYGTHCFNLRCPGFFWTNRDIPLDIPLRHLSVYGGQQYDIEIQIFQDFNSKNWWLRLHSHLLGYWPNGIVPKLGDGAHIHAFGGKILNKRLSGHHTGTRMGSGHFAEEGFRKAAYIKKVMILEDPRAHFSSPSYSRRTTFVTHPNCYNLEFGHPMDLEWGYNFFYGGPGRCKTCT